jgi:hypothetical protein
MITVKRGDVVQVRGERDLILVTDAADQDPDAYRTYSFILGRDETGQVFEQEFVSSEMPVETIFMGYRVHPELLEDPNIGEEGYEPQTFVSDMSEVISIVE